MEGAGDIIQLAADDEKPTALEDLPEATLRFMVSFLHSFSIVGQPANVNKAFAAACQNDVLSQHVFVRDLEEEEATVLPAQPWRSCPHPLLWVEQPLSLGDLCMDGHDVGAHLRLCSIVQRLHNLPFLSIGHCAASEGRPALLLWTSARCDLNHMSATSSTLRQHKARKYGDVSALMIAAAANHPRTTACAATVCDLEQGGPFGTALHHAAFLGAAAAVRELLLAGASTSARNATYNQTPLHVACSRNHGEVVSLLLDHGADPNVGDKDGLTARDVAHMMRSNAAEQVLMDRRVNAQ